MDLALTMSFSSAIAWGWWGGRQTDCRIGGLLLPGLPGLAALSGLSKCQVIATGRAQ